MSLARKQALISCIAWLIICAAFVTVFFTTGAENFAAPASRGARVLTAAIILPGYVLNLGLLWWSRRGRRTGELDERDEIIARRASQATLTILAVLVFAGSIALFETHAEVGTVPVGWLYFMAYGTMALVSLVHPAVALALDFKGPADG